MPLVNLTVLGVVTWRTPKVKPPQFTKLPGVILAPGGKWLPLPAGQLLPEGVGVGEPPPAGAPGPEPTLGQAVGVGAGVGVGAAVTANFCIQLDGQYIWLPASTLATMNQYSSPGVSRVTRYDRTDDGTSAKVKRCSHVLPAAR